jgi:lysophospholipase L1-like esterase
MNSYFPAYLHICIIAIICSSLIFSNKITAQDSEWVATWRTAQQLVESRNMPPAPGLTNNSLRQIIRPSIGGDSLRMSFSNEYSEDPVTLMAVKIAVSSGNGTIYDSTSKTLTFNGNCEYTMEPGTFVVSDPIAFQVEPRTDLAITIYYGGTSATATGHPGSRTTSYLIAGNDTSINAFSGAATTDHWYTIDGLDVLTPSPAYSVAILGNSITGGRGSVTNMQNRWPDYLSLRFLSNPSTEKVGVLNMGIGGNCLLRPCLGPAGMDRFVGDLLDPSGVEAIILFIGVNDIGAVGSAESTTEIANGLIDGYKTIIDSAHARGIMIYGATITPFKGSGYYNRYSEACRQKVNYWIKYSESFDAVFDFDEAVRNPDDTLSVISTYQNDGLHPDTAMYRRMVNSIDLSLFEGLDTLSPEVDTTKIAALWIEPECGNVGNAWETYLDPSASNQSYIEVDVGLNSTNAVPESDTTKIFLQVDIPADSVYYLYSRVNSGNTDADSYWLQVGHGDFTLYEGLNTEGWEWRSMGQFSLTAGVHGVTVALSEEGMKLDKFYFSTEPEMPTGLGKPADLVCMPDTSTPQIVDYITISAESDGYFLAQNYPNPFTHSTTFSFSIPRKCYVSLKILSSVGLEIAELAGKEFSSGQHAVQFNDPLPMGIYLYTLKTDDFQISKTMVVGG